MEVPNFTLEFKDITYDVVLKAGKDAGQTKRILHDISSSCVSGKLTALMGPSGAGKSSLLDILAGVKVVGKARGQVLLNGSPRRSAAFASLCSYVQQKDVLVPSATVREALVTSALLKLPHSMSKSQKLARVDQLLDLLELSHVADSYIGDEAMGIKGISGGEKRRVSVGIEVVKDPAIIFLDEPTTGLDSEMALGVTTSLKAMAKAGKMVVATIHQPNSAITDAFDDWALLARGGCCGGPACPLYRNPTDFFMSLASSAATLAALADAWAARQADQREGAAAAAASRQLDSQPQHDTCSISGSDVQLWQPAAAKSADVEQGLRGAARSRSNGIGSFRLRATPSSLSCSECSQGAAAGEGDKGGFLYRMLRGGSGGSGGSAAPFWPRCGC
ncbi:P-loop containing nucleoside triphosphate hydrolase protein [Scenedesmus sp. NREL 46B-D3]|nr:P-loop containing nucleoside triphosphate hydrolase protein [Scenedesmus sp. NREL 46B-D3]